MPRLPNPQTKDKLLDAAEGLMLQKGFTAATVDDICAAAGLTKGSFFHYFTNKHQVAVEAVQRFYSRAQQMFASAPYHTHPDPLDRVYGYLDLVQALAENPAAMKGCLIGSLAQELSDTDDDMRQVCAECFADWSQGLQRDLDAAKKKYAPRARWTTASLADHCIAVIEGALILVKSKRDPAALRTSIDHLRRYLESLLEKNKG